MSTKPNTKLCTVCGDVALCYNFHGQLSCMSCRMFFQRNVAKREILVCGNSNRCQITPTTRKYCPSCRLEKCFAIGMKLPAIRLPRQVEDVVRASSPTRSRALCPLTLGKYESHCIKAILASLEYFPNEASLPSRPIGSAQELTRVVPSYLHQAIGYIKKIPAYSLMSYEMKLKFFRGMYAIWVPIRYAFQYKQDQDAYVVMSGTNKAETITIRRSLYYNLETDSALYEANTKFLVNFSQDLEGDATIRDLLFATINADQMYKCLGADYARFFYHTNCYLLKRYLEAKYDNEELAAAKYCRLMDCTFNKMALTFAAFMRWCGRSDHRFHHIDEAFVEIASSF